jgi:hypothetical protein
MRESEIRTRSRQAFANFSQYFRGGVSRHKGNGDHSSTRRFHFFASNDLIAGPVAAFHQNIGQEFGDGLAGRKFMENHYGVHAPQRRKNLRALAFRKDWPALTFKLPNAGIAVQPNDKNIAEFARLFQTANMPRMQKIKAAIRENDAPPFAFLAAKPHNRFL